MDRMIFHMDINHCYAQIEEMKYPELRRVPMAVGGRKELRHGIVLARNAAAARYGVKTGETLMEADRKCPGLLIIPPSYEDYVYYAGLVREIYREYSDRVEPFGLDEAWIEYTGSRKLFGDPLRAAEEIRRRVKRETELTISAGVSWNKVFAKLGSDLKNPHGPCVISRRNFRDVVWPLPVEKLLYAGPSSVRRLHAAGIRTIGELAAFPRPLLKWKMGAIGEILHAFACGEENAPVARAGTVPADSVSFSLTLLRDVRTAEEMKPVCRVVSEMITSRLRRDGLAAGRLAVFFRTDGFVPYARERRLPQKTSVSADLAAAAWELLGQIRGENAIRSFGMTAGSLSADAGIRQISLLEDEKHHEQERRTDLAMDAIRNRYGYDAVWMAGTAADAALWRNAAGMEHEIHPMGYFRGRRMHADGTV